MDEIGFVLLIDHAHLVSSERSYLISELNSQSSSESSGLEARFVEDLMGSIADSGIDHLCLDEDH